MMDGINNFTNISKLHNVSGTKPANILSNSPPQQIFTRGDPPAYTTGLERNVVPEELRDKFDGIPKHSEIYKIISNNTDFIEDIDYQTTGINSDKILDIPEEILSG